MSTKNDTPKPRRVADVDLQVPPSQARMQIVVRLARTAPEAAMGAAWGLCSRGPGRVIAQWRPADPAGYGEQVLDELLTRGAPYDEVVEACKRAFEMVLASVISEERVEEAAGNFEAPAAH